MILSKLLFFFLLFEGSRGRMSPLRMTNFDKKIRVSLKVFCSRLECLH